MKKVLILEDDQSIQRILVSALSQHFFCTVVETVAAAYRVLEKKQFEIAIIDRVLPDGDGLEVVEYLQENSFPTKVMALSRQGSVGDRVSGLEAGADEYLPKPFSLAELKLKVHKLALVEKRHPESTLQVGELKFFPETGCLTTPAGSVHLRKKEAAIFHCLLRYKNQVVSRETIVADVWNNSFSPSQTTLDVYLRRIRVLLREYHQLIKTIRGFGYTLSDSAVDGV